MTREVTMDPVLYGVHSNIGGRNRAGWIASLLVEWSDTNRNDLLLTIKQQQTKIGYRHTRSMEGKWRFLFVYDQPLGWVLLFPRDLLNGQKRVHRTLTGDGGL